MESSSKVNVVLVQSNPKLKKVKKNIKKVEELLPKYSKTSEIDVIVLPEIAFSGYVFDSEEEIIPFLEKFDSGPTF